MTPRQSDRPKLLPPPAPPDPDALLKVPEGAALLRVPASFIYAETRKGAESRIPFVRVGRYVRLRRRDLFQWVEQNRLGGTPEAPALGIVQGGKA